jgi:hypothetical protein
MLSQIRNTFLCDHNIWLERNNLNTTK